MKNPERTLGKVVRFFKARSCKLIRDSGYPEFGWQRNYYEHVIRDERDLFRIRSYIKYNPLRWLLDIENPRNILTCYHSPIISP